MNSVFVPKRTGPLNVDVIREATRGQWKSRIYPELGIDVRSDNRHGPCPHCGGKDRFRCDDKQGSGSHFCNQCGAGDGFALVKKVRGCSFCEALRLVAGVLGLDSHAPIDRAVLERQRRQRELDRLKKERRRELDGLTIDALRAAESFICSRSGIDISSWTGQRLDDELNALADAYRLIESEGLNG